MISENAAEQGSRSIKDTGGSSKQDNIMAFEDAQSRADMYRFLAAVYLHPPTQELMSQIMDEEFLNQLSLFFSEISVAKLQSYFSSTEVNNGHALLEQEYMDLFAVPSGRYITPFEDIYRGGTGKNGIKTGPVMGGAAIAVKRLYRQAGAEMDKTCMELPTHIGIELSFMSYLCEREAMALRDDKEAGLQSQDDAHLAEPGIYHQLQQLFLRNHLTIWFPQLSLAIQTNAHTAFYPGLAQITEEYLTRDMESLDTDTVPVSTRREQDTVQGIV